jgi:hypothetical protein
MRADGDGRPAFEITFGLIRIEKLKTDRALLLVTNCA